MKATRKKWCILLAVLIAAVFLCMTLADYIQRDGGAVTVTEGVLESDAGRIPYKLYTPASATGAAPAPGVLLLHGYQNDHETCAAYAIELARRGAVVLLEYIPFFAGIGPGADVLFGSTFGGPFMSLLILFAPQVVLFSLLGTYIYRRTGNVYGSALVMACLACWIVTGGSAIL